MRLSVGDNDKLRLELVGGPERYAAMMLTASYAASPDLDRRKRSVARGCGRFIAAAFPIEVRETGFELPIAVLVEQRANCTVDAVRWYAETVQHCDSDEEHLPASLQPVALDMYLSICEWRDARTDSSGIQPR